MEITKEKIIKDFLLKEIRGLRFIENEMRITKKNLFNLADKFNIYDEIKKEYNKKIEGVLK